MSGLICLDWYDWNSYRRILVYLLLRSRDWSVLIDTIETVSKAKDIIKPFLSGLICLDWYDWNHIVTDFAWPRELQRRDWSVLIDTIETGEITIFSTEDINMSGLICLDWYDWNHTYWLLQRCVKHRRDWSVLIDTIETFINTVYVIKLNASGRDWSVLIDAIETSSVTGKQLPVFQSLGLICLDWYDWNVC